MEENIMHSNPIHATAVTPGFEHPRWGRVRFIDSAPGTDGTPPAGGDGSTPPAAPPATPPATPATIAQQQQQAPAGGEDIASLPAWAQKQISDLRAENAKDRTNAKATAAEEAKNNLIQEIGKALGLVTDGDQTPTAEQLTAQLASSTTAAADAQRELAVFKAAASVPGADASTLLDSRTVLTAIKDITPDDTAALKAAIEKALTDNPRLKHAPAAGKSGGDLTGGTGEHNSKTPKTLHDAISGAYNR